MLIWSRKEQEMPASNTEVSFCGYHCLFESRKWRDLQTVACPVAHKDKQESTIQLTWQWDEHHVVNTHWLSTGLAKGDGGGGEESSGRFQAAWQQEGEKGQRFRPPVNSVLHTNQCSAWKFY